MTGNMSDDDYRKDILSAVDNIIEKINNLRKVMLGVSLSAVALAPFAIGLSIYLMLHPSFFSLLEAKDEFGLFLVILLGGIISISAVWLYTGLRQYFSLNDWNKRYLYYFNKKTKVDSSIRATFNLDES